ncbi:sulfite exporter TauE/SafE family protein [Riemerella columbina]|uniref:sulfite exporter TauE/SafE family protein n=1 Tax=Riemerella columbina TaxID=103810 RepID=UPI00266FD947|nr:sulfite exporter TauE/SafE family protein [Riemerella columbina]WKS96020.1 sulfite exporter TauE/SafE family protein [Riemerella columbina]
MVIKIIVLLASTVVAFWLSAICGGGASLILIPVLNWLLPSSVVPFSLTIGTFTSSASRIAVFKKHISWKIFFWFVPFSIPAVLLGAYFIKFVNPVYLQLIVAIFLIANVPQLFISRKEQKKEERPYPQWVLGLVGFMAGFVSGITGAIGLLFNRFYLKYGLSKEQIVATRAANEICLHLIKLVIYIALGLFSKMAILLGLIIALGAVISSYTVKFILPHLSEFLFRKIGYGAMVLSGVMLLVSTSQKIIEQDQIKVHNSGIAGESEISIQWRKSNFVLEFALDDGLEVERPISAEELPENLYIKYEILRPQYDRIELEKVYRLGEEPSFEFYLYKNSTLKKLEFE